VWLGVASAKGAFSKKFNFSGSRAEIRQAAALMTLKEVQIALS